MFKTEFPDNVLVPKDNSVTNGSNKMVKKMYQLYYCYFYYYQRMFIFSFMIQSKLITWWLSQVFEKKRISLTESDASHLKGKLVGTANQISATCVTDSSDIEAKTFHWSSSFNTLNTISGSKYRL